MSRKMSFSVPAAAPAARCAATVRRARRANLPAASTCSATPVGPSSRGLARPLHTVPRSRQAAFTSSGSRSSPRCHAQPVSPVARCSARTLATHAPSENGSATAPYRDIVIVGAGPVGLSVACGIVSATLRAAPAASGKRARPYPSITVVEGGDLSRLRSWAANAEAAVAKSDQATPWENRVISLTAENMSWLEEMGVAPYLVRARLRPVCDMRVWDGLSGAAIEFHADEVFGSSSSSGHSPGFDNRPTLSYMVEISNLQQAMLRFLEEQSEGQVQIRDRARVQSILAGSASEVAAGVQAEEEKDPWPTLVLGQSTGDAVESEQLRARLLIGADGPNSPVRKYAGIDNYGWEYGRRGVVGTLRCAPPITLHPSSPDAGAQASEPAPFGNTAFQRFLPSGPIAFLPLEDAVGSMVWTLPPEIARAVEQVHRDTPANATVQPFAELVSAAFRLPWRYIEQIFNEIQAQLRDNDLGAAPATGAAADRPPAQDWSWIVARITDAVADAGGLEALPDHSHGFVPPPVRSVDTRSVASFPLQVKHADAYLGPSLTGPSPSESADSPSPTPLLPSLSGVLNAGLTLLGLNSAHASTDQGRGRTALVGDAAHSIHPLAGQGLNLGLADSRALAETLERAVQAGADLGSYTALAPYPRARYWENQKMLSAVDHLHWLYAAPVPLRHRAPGAPAGAPESPLRALAREGFSNATVWARSTGLEVVNELSVLKNAFMRQAGGRGAK